MKKTGGSQKESVKVMCRIRPTNQIEINKGGVTCVKNTENSIDVQTDEQWHPFSFDNVFGPESTQQDVFQTAEPLIADVLAGYNATIFAYGQTGTGKTHTMEGDINSPIQKGIVPRAVEALFDGVAEADENIEFSFKVSYVEIYMEKIRDLLDSNQLKKDLTVREDKVKGIYIAGVTEEYVTSDEELLDIMSNGAMNRKTAATGMNEGSSRSHSMFTITVHQRDVLTNTTRQGKLVLVDLAGSEMVKKTNASGQQLEEAKTINKSLSALGQVINALTDDRSTHVPYRDSKLTRVLQDSLGGNAKTILIVAVSPSSFNANETISTCRFGMRAKNIENKVTINQTRSVEELEQLLARAEKAIDTQQSHIQSLMAQIQSLKLEKGIPLDDSPELSNSAVEAAEQAKADAFKALEAAQETIQRLTEELEEERTESKRKDTEMTGLTNMLKDKERLLQEAGELLQEAQRHYENQRERSDQLVREKADAVGKLEGVRSQMNEMKAKFEFDMKELEVSVETLRTENGQLQAEIAEMSGDAPATPKPREGASTRTPSKRQEDISFGLDDEAQVAVNDGSAGVGAGAGASAGAEAAATLTSAGRSKQLAEAVAALNAIVSKYGISSDAAAELAALVNSQAAGNDATSTAFESKLQAADRLATEQSRRIRDMEVQRTRLERDLAGRSEKLMKLQFDMDALRGMDGVTQAEFISERERAHMRSLQQRLEQLVVVHRQLLRKFASLELENSEYRKKIMLRDERIKQLETNSRSITGSMRQQAERHVAELTNLREQIQLLRTEHYQRMEAKESQLSHSKSFAARTLRGGQAHGGTIQGGSHRGGTIQGGGGRTDRSSSMTTPMKIEAGSEQLVDPPSPYAVPAKGDGQQDAGSLEGTEDKPAGGGGLFSRVFGKS